MNIQKIEDISDTREVWETLLESSLTGTVFQQPTFLESWWERFKNDSGKRLLLAGYDGDELVGVGPFEAEGNTVRFLGMRAVLGSEELVDYGDVVAKRGREEAVWQEL